MLINSFLNLIFDIFFSVLNAGFALLSLAFGFIRGVSGHFASRFLRFALNVLAGSFGSILNTHWLFLYFSIFILSSLRTGFVGTIRQEEHFTPTALDYGAIEEILKSSPTDRDSWAEAKAFADRVREL
jgi:hypothetical protein